MLDLPPGDFRQIGVVHHVRVALRQLRYRNGNNLLVTAPLVRHLEHADRPHRNHGAGNDQGIAILGEGVRDEAIVPRIAHGRVEKAVDDQRSRFLVHLVFYRLAADRHLDDRVHLLGRISTDRDIVEVHRWLAAWCFALSVTAANRQAGAAHAASDRNFSMSSAVSFRRVTMNKWPSSMISSPAFGMRCAQTGPLMTGTKGSSRPMSTSVGWRNVHSHGRLLQPTMARS